MPYFTVEEIKNQKKPEVEDILKNYEGRNVRDLFAARLVEKYQEQILGNETPEVKILDYGAASGAFAAQLHQRGFRELYGLDIDNYLDADKKNLVKDFKTVDLNGGRFPWPDNYFDMITAWCVLPHLENPHHCIRETKRLLKPGGLLIFSIPHLSSKTSKSYFCKHGDFARFLPSTNHISIFTPGVIENTILKYFQKVNLEYLMDPRIFSGVRGKIRKFIFKLAGANARTKNYIEKLWGYNQIWVVKK